MENGLGDTAGEREDRTSGESNPDIYTLSCVKQVTGGKMLYNPGSATVCSLFYLFIYFVLGVERASITHPPDNLSVFNYEGIKKVQW